MTAIRPSNVPVAQTVRTLAVSGVWGRVDPCNSQAKFPINEFINWFVLNRA